MISSEDGRDRLGAANEGEIVERLSIIAVVIALVFGIFFVRLFQLQLILSDDLRLRSQRNYVRSVRLEAPRGDILDREGRVLVTTRPAFGVGVIPNELRDRSSTFEVLAALLDADPGELAAKVGRPSGRKRFQQVRVAADLGYDQRVRVESHLFGLPGVVTDMQPRRHYVAGPLGAHVLGYLGEVQGHQLTAEDFAGYRSGEFVGQAGVEALRQKQLRGRAGGRNLVVDVAGRVVGPPLNEIEPAPGADVHLSIDLDLQRAAEQAFLPRVLGGRANTGALVALDVRTGEVLAMVSKPAFDPNDFAGGIEARIWDALLADEWQPIQNRVISGQYPPGSTYKAVVAAAAMEDGLASPDRKLFCPGSFRHGNRRYRCWKPAGHGWVDLERALTESCDVYFYQMGTELGIDRMAFFAEGMGFGRATGLSLPSEQAGLVPSRDWKKRRFGEAWLPGETVSAAIGQGFNLVTPLQIAVAYAAIANGGFLLRPRLLLEAGAAPEPELLGRVPVSDQNLVRLREALEMAVEGDAGTGARARVPGVRVAGKTGTAQVVALRHTIDLKDEDIKLRHRDHAWFVGFAPAQAPEIVVAAILEHSGHGGSAAAPLVQRVLAAYFEKQSSAEELPVRTAVGPRASADPGEGVDLADR
ncbi:MAG: penicillin-binding protein 2 [Myxococcota bacterium]